MNIKKITMVSALALVSSAGLAMADTLQLSELSFSFTDATGTNGNFTSDATAGNPATLYWGVPAEDGGDQSGYKIAAGDPVPSSGVDVDTEFDFGTFTHYNQPILLNAGTLTGVNLNVSANVSNNNVVIGAVTFQFGLQHDETPNIEDNCPDQSNPCDDIVKISMLNTTDTFTLGTIEYTLNLSGFIQDGVEVSTFTSSEGGTNTAGLRGIFTADVPAVPLPAAGWMLFAGLGGLAAMKRRKQPTA